MSVSPSELFWRRSVSGNFTTARLTVISIRGEKEEEYRAGYIATMAYGSYDHLQVQVPRRYRDEYLMHRRWRRRFIDAYYRYSPAVVRRLECYPRVNQSIRVCQAGQQALLYFTAIISLCKVSVYHISKYKNSYSSDYEQVNSPPKQLPDYAGDCRDS